jgi:LPS sulfotransferase NodH
MILFPGRAGGTFLLGGLKQHPELRTKGEPLGIIAPRGADFQMDWLRKYYRGPLMSKAHAIGILTKFPDIVDPDRTADLLRTIDARVICLDRENHVKSAISMIRARRLKDATGRWNVYTSSNALEAFAIDPEDFEQRLAFSQDRKAATADYANALGLPLLRITYEQLLTQDDETFRRVFEFLGVSPQTVTSKTLKVTSDDLRDSVLNFDELRARYVGTPYEAMFDEVLQPQG